MKENVREEKEKIIKDPRTVRVLKMVNYLKKHTDKEHTTSQASIRADKTTESYIGAKESFNSLIKDLAEALNFDKNGFTLPENEWKIVFDDFRNYYGDEPTKEFPEDDSKVAMRINNLYYNNSFSHDAIDILIESINLNDRLDSITARELKSKIKNELTSKFYKSKYNNIRKIYEPEIIDKKELDENLIIIQQAIDDEVEISFKFNGYNNEKKLVPIRLEKDVVSPYYIVTSGGRYYLLACMNNKKSKNMSIWRIDLMTELEINGKDKKTNDIGTPRIPKEEVQNLPQKWNDDFKFSHLNMSFDEPRDIILRIKRFKDSRNNVRPGYTFMHDWFGDTFEYIKTEDEEQFYDIVKVKTSPFAMANWALQYSDLVEVIEPEDVRDEIKKKIQGLNSKYFDL